MSMDKSAIQHIQDTTNIPAVIEHLTKVKTQVPVVVTPNSMSIESLEKFMPNASRYRLQYATTSIADFIEYNELRDEEGATCFVDAEGMSAKSIFDLGTIDAPGHKQHVATLRLIATAAFKAIGSANGQHMRQKQAGELLEDWSDHVIAYTKDGTTMTPHQAARALQDLTIEAAREINSKVDDFGESMSAMERIEAKNQDKIPAEIHFSCEPYSGLRERKFKIRVGILTGDAKPQVVFRILRLESIEEEIAEEFKGLLVDASENLSLKTFIGEV